jgi:stage II sporulation protein D
MTGGRKRCAAAVLVAAAFAACTHPGSLGDPGDLPAELRVGTGQGSVVRVALEDYVLVAVLSEMVPAAADRSAAERIFEVQAVIARTYAAAHRARHASEGFDLCSTSHCQLYERSRLERSAWVPVARQAVRRTTGRILWHGSAPARAVFHADCGGFISAAESVWAGDARPYLKAGRDDGPAEGSHSAWRFSASRAEIIRALNADPRTRIGKDLRSIRVVERDAAGRARLLLLQGSREPLVRGEEFRGVLLRRFGVRSIRSTLFDVVLRGDAFVFTGRGFGHGVGLCQAGAVARLRSGASPEQVLDHYFPGTRLNRAR